MLRGCLEGEDQKRLDFLSKALSDLRYSANKATYLPWAKFFEKGEWRNIKYQVEPLLAYWLSYFLFQAAQRTGFTATFFLLLSYYPREGGWPQRIFIKALYVLSATSACIISLAQFVGTTLSLMLTHLYIKCFYGRGLRLCPLGQSSSRLSSQKR